MMDNLRCSYCVKEFKYESEKKRHEISHFPRFQCEICDKKFSFISALRRHEKQHKRTEKVQCAQCSRSFRDESLLQRHIKYAHKGKYTCNKCNAQFYSELALGTHAKIHNDKSERKYRCHHVGCEKTFNFAHHLKHHELTHTKTKQHYCQICRKGFIQNHHLKTHMKVHEPEKWVHCTEINCKKKFPTEYSRKRHLLHTHNIKLDDISANSNEDSSDLKCSVKIDTVLCTLCGEIVDKFLYNEHHLKCSQESTDRPEDLYENNNNAEQKETETQTNNNDADETSNINDCKRVLGNCIMNSDSSEECLCAQIKTTVHSADNYYDSILIPDENLNSSNIQSNVNMKCTSNDLFQPYKVTNDVADVACLNCECSKNLQRDYLPEVVNNLNATKQNTRKICNSHNISNTRIPDIEYKVDGSIKLKDTFDSDILVFGNVTAEIKENKGYETHKSNYVPFNSCKAVLGKCIVSGNGTMSDECLCAKMLVDEQQVTAEEIDEITPHPTVSYLKSSVI